MQYGAAPVSAMHSQRHLFFCLLHGLRNPALTPVESPPAMQRAGEGWRPSSQQQQSLFLHLWYPLSSPYPAPERMGTQVPQLGR